MRMPVFRRDLGRQIAMCQCFRFHLQVDPGKAIGGSPGRRPKARRNGIDVEAGTNEVNRTRMSKTMRTDAVCCERWQGFGRLFDCTMNKTVDAESRGRLIEAIKEHKILC